MLPEQRRRQVLEYLSSNGAGNVAELAEELGVSVATVRRDLMDLERGGKIKRTHGGAVLPHFSLAFEPDHGVKATAMIAEKRAIARRAAAMVNDGQVVILDSGSTTLQLARELQRKRGLTIVTTDLNVALELCDVPTHEVIMVGGRVRRHLYNVIGPIAEWVLDTIHANHVFMGADAIHLQEGVTNANLDEVPIKRMAIASGKNRVLLADHTKFGRTSLAKVTDLAAFDSIITDWGAPSEMLSAFAAAGVTLDVAEES